MCFNCSIFANTNNFTTVFTTYAMIVNSVISPTLIMYFKWDEENIKSYLPVT